MPKILAIIISFCILSGSCNNSKSTENKVANIPLDKVDVSNLNNALKKYEEPSQNFKVSTTKPSEIIGQKGTRVLIQPDDLETESGKPLGQNIEIELKELTNQGQLLRANAQTSSDGKILVSGGAYFIGMASNGEELKLKEGRKLNIQFPKSTDKEMTLFYGQRNDLGQMNWQKARDIFKATQQSASTSPTKDSISTIGSEYPREGTDMDAIIDYVERDSSTTLEGKEGKIQRRKNYVISQQVYDAIGIDKLGWINCDRFLEEENTTSIYATFKQKDSIKNANVYLIFSDINSVIQGYFYSDNLPQFDNMPIGYKTRLIAYTVKDEKVFAYSTDLTIAKGQKLVMDLKEISDKDFGKLINN